MTDIQGRKWSTHELDEVAISLDNLTKQMMIANQMKAAEILYEQSKSGLGMTKECYQNFLWDVFHQE